MENIVEAYVKMLQNYAVFSGRSRRSDFWYAFLGNFIIGVILAILGLILPPLKAVTWVYGVAVLVPGIAIMIRRLHDTDKSGVWVLIGLVPAVGEIILLVLCAMDSEPDNLYGPNPKTAQPTA